MESKKETPEGGGPGPGQNNGDHPNHNQKPAKKQEKYEPLPLGWIALHRQLIDSRTFQNEGLLKVWIWCLLKARHKPGWATMSVGRSETEVWLETGQFVYGRKSAAKQLRMKPSSIRNRMEKLKNMRNLDIESNTHYSIVTIINWDVYQGQKNKEDIEKDHRRTPGGHPEDTNNNENNVNNEKKETTTTENSSCSCEDPFQEKNPAGHQGDKHPPVDSNQYGLPPEVLEFIQLETDRAWQAGKIRSTKQAYRHGLIKRAKDGVLDISGLDELRAAVKHATANPKKTQKSFEWLFANQSAADVFGIDEKTFRDEEANGIITFNPTDQTYGRMVDDETMVIAKPDGTVEKMEIGG